MRNTLIFLFIVFSQLEAARAAIPCGEDEQKIAGKIDPQNLIRPEILQSTLAYYGCHKSEFENLNFISIIDYKLHSAKKRLYVLDLKKFKILTYLTAHGSGSDPVHTGFAQKFSDVPKSNASSLGFYKTAEIYQGAHGRTLALDGLSSTNQNARKRMIVLHGAAYVDPKREKMGRSWGCPSVENSKLDEIVDMIKGGSLLAVFN